MIEHGRSEGFALKAFTSTAGSFSISGGRKHQRDMAIQLEVFGFVNHTHTKTLTLPSGATFTLASFSERRESFLQSRRPVDHHRDRGSSAFLARLNAENALAVRANRVMVS